MEDNRLLENFVLDVTSAIGSVVSKIADFFSKIFGKAFSDGEKQKFDSTLKKDKNWKEICDYISCLDIKNEDLEIKETATAVLSIEKILGSIGNMLKDVKNATLNKKFEETSLAFNLVLQYNMQSVNDVLKQEGEKEEESPNNQATQPNDEQEEKESTDIKDLDSDTELKYDELVKNNEVKDKLSSLGVTDEESLQKLKQFLIDKKETLEL